MNMDRVASDKGWLVKRLTANGLSFSHMICLDGKGEGAEGSEDKRLSRRVEFRVRTNAESGLRKSPPGMARQMTESAYDLLGIRKDFPERLRRRGGMWSIRSLT